jgi:predicted Fe-S protein YdhL (DUF1289 family)
MGWLGSLFGRRGDEAAAPAAPRARAIVNLEDARARHVPGEVPSPCISVCQMDPQTGFCRGCWRSIDEIADWSRMDEAQRLAAWERIEARQIAAGRCRRG